MTLDKFLAQKFFYNSVENWLWFVGLLLIGWLFRKIISVIVSQVVYRLIQRETENVSIREFVNLLKRPVEFLISIVFISMAVLEVDFPTRWRVIPLAKVRFVDFLDRILDTLFIISIAWLVIRLIKFFELVFINKFQKNSVKNDEHLVPFIRFILVSVVVFISFFFILGFVFKQDVVSLVTGLGIGGVAIALAARATLENLFASFTLFTEQPFVVGDEIELGTTISGKIEKVAFRSTQIRSADGSLIIVPNQLLVSQAVNNTTQRRQRRHKFPLHLKLTTPLEKIQAVINDIQQLFQETELIEESGSVRLDSIGDYSINLMIVFFVNTPDFGVSQNLRNEVNFKILEILKKHEVEIAQPQAQSIEISSLPPNPVQSSRIL